MEKTSRRYLYKVFTNFASGYLTGMNHSYFYVVATDTSTAYMLVRDFLDKENLGFNQERSMKSIELIAETSMYPECRTMLIVQPITTEEKDK